MQKRNRKMVFEQPVDIKGTHDYTYTTFIGTRGVILPFSTGGKNTTNLTVNSSGFASNGIIASFSNGSISTVGINNLSFTQGSAHYYSFIMPFDAVLQTISMVAINTAQVSGDYYPYVAIATAEPGSFEFTINTYNKAIATCSGSAGYTANSGEATDLNFLITAGTRVAIVCAMDASPGATARVFNYSGSLFFTQESY